MRDKSDAYEALRDITSPRFLPMKEKHSASSSDGIAVFQAYTDLINSERETLWARHNALLLANSLIIGALAVSPAALWENKWAALGMLSAGLVISAAWLGIAVHGWSALRRHADIAGSFASACFTHLPNPFAETICNRAQTRIHHLIVMVIAVFMLMYLGLGFVRLL
jgi:hypothetical protein